MCNWKEIGQMAFWKETFNQHIDNVDALERFIAMESFKDSEGAKSLLKELESLRCLPADFAISIYFDDDIAVPGNAVGAVTGFWHAECPLGGSYCSCPPTSRCKMVDEISIGHSLMIPQCGQFRSSFQ